MDSSEIGRPELAAAALSRWPVVLLAVLATMAPLGFLFAEAWRAHAKLDVWLSDAHARLPNVRLLPRDCRLTFIDRFVDKHIAGRDDVWLFMGDSTVFNQGISHADLFSTKLAQGAGYPVVLAVQDMRPNDVISIAKLLESKSIFVEKAFVNMNHAVYSMDPKHRLGNIFPGVGPSAYMMSNYFACILKYRKVILGTHIYGAQESWVYKPGEKYIELKPTRSRFQVRSEAITQLLIPILGNLTRISKRTYSYVSPNSLEDIQKFETGMSEYRQASGMLMDGCSSVKGVTCVDFSELLQKRELRDIGHMNPAGNGHLAQIFRKIVLADGD